MDNLKDNLKDNEEIVAVWNDIIYWEGKKEDINTYEKEENVRILVQDCLLEEEISIDTDEVDFMSYKEFQDKKYIREWCIIFNDDSFEDFYTENEQEYLDYIEDLKNNNNYNKIFQSYIKDYELICGDYEEVNCDILIDNI